MNLGPKFCNFREVNLSHFSLMRNFFDLSWRFEQCQNKYPTNQLIINPLMAQRLSARLFCNLQGYSRFQLFFRNFQKISSCQNGRRNYIIQRVRMGTEVLLVGNIVWNNSVQFRNECENLGPNHSISDQNVATCWTIKFRPDQNSGSVKNGLKLNEKIELISSR